MSSKKTRKCTICGVKESHRPGFYASFPSNEDRCRAWVKAVGNEDLIEVPIEMLTRRYYVCSEHFEKKFFNKKCNRLKRTAVPTLKICLSPLLDHQLKEFPLHVAKRIGQKTSSQPSIIAQPSTSTDQLPTTSRLLQSSDNAQASFIVEQSTHNTGVKQNVKENIGQKTSSLPLNIAQPSTSNDQLPTTSQLLQSPINAAASSSAQPSMHNQGVKRSLEETIDLTPRKKKLLGQLQRTKCTLQSLKKSSILVEKIDSPILKQLVVDAVKNQKRKPKGQRWNLKNKISALAIFKRSAKTYRYLSHVIPLPSEKTLQTLSKKIPVTTGLNSAVLKHLTITAQKRPKKENICSLVFDEMSIKPCVVYNEGTDSVEGFEDYGDSDRKEVIANKALVFMVQGLYKKFKQPIAFYFVKGTVSKERLAVLIKNAIKEINKTGFRVICTICDQGPTNSGALTILSGRATNYFSLDSSDEKIYKVFDVPHLFKSIRNNFLNHGKIIFQGIPGKWQHLLEVQKKNENLLRLSKITKVHVDPKYRAKMRVKYAAQALSLTVSAVLKLMSEAANDEKIAKEFMDTAVVVEKLDSLFDLTNGPSGPKDIKKGKRLNVSTKTNHEEQWTQLKSAVGTIKFMKADGTEATKVRCVKGYLTTLNSLQDIWNETKTLGYKYLNLRQLNQDALKNFFGIIRQHSPTNKYPTCSTFIGAVKSSIVTGLTAHSRNSNCEKDTGSLLTNFQNLLLENQDPETINEPIETNLLTKNTLSDSDEIQYDFHLPDFCDDQNCLNELTDIDEQATVYVSGYLVSTLTISNCTICHNLLTSKDYGNRLFAYTRLREWWTGKASLQYPSIALCKEIKAFKDVFQKEIIDGKKFHVQNIKNLCITLFLSVSDFSWLSCSHKQEVVHNILEKLSKLLIRRQCHRINLVYKEQSEETASRAKKAEQTYKD